MRRSRAGRLTRTTSSPTRAWLGHQMLSIRLAPAPGGTSTLYFILAGIGVFTSSLGHRCGCTAPRSATLHFFWLCLAFFGTLTFSFSRLDRLVLTGQMRWRRCPRALLRTSRWSFRIARHRGFGARERFTPLLYRRRDSCLAKLIAVGRLSLSRVPRLRSRPRIRSAAVFVGLHDRWPRGADAGPWARPSATARRQPR
jgi:hypothetical protein